LAKANYHCRSQDRQLKTQESDRRRPIDKKVEEIAVLAAFIVPTGGEYYLLRRLLYSKKIWMSRRRSENANISK